MEWSGMETSKQTGNAGQISRKCSCLCLPWSLERHPHPYTTPHTLHSWLATAPLYLVAVWTPPLLPSTHHTQYTATSP